MRFVYIFILGIIFTGGLARAQVAVIAHPGAPAEQLSKSELLDFYTRDVRTWNTGEPVIVFDLKQKNTVKKIFYQFLGKSTSRMKSIWMKKMLSGEGDPPEALSSQKKVGERVLSTPGAIGFVSVDSIPDGAKVLLRIEAHK